MTAGFGWGAIARLGLVQAAIGAIVVLTTSTLNRLMVVELALPALVPGLLVGLHYAVQLMRPRVGHGCDQRVRRTPWIVGGMAVLAAGGSLAALATAWMATQRGPGLALAVLAFVLIGLGVAAAGTSLLVLLAERVAAPRRAGAATLVWLMMIAGFAVTAGLAGRALEPYSPLRLVQVCTGVSLAAFCVALLALWRLEDGTPLPEAGARPPPQPFRQALAGVWADAEARRFTVFVFASMLAFSAQDLILEPFAGAVFGYGPGETTRLSGLQHGGVLTGMLLAAFAGRRHFGSLRAWTAGGCLASALALGGLVAAAAVGPAWPLRPNVFLLGAANGAFSIAAIGSMMRLAGEGSDARAGVRMGVWGAAQAIAFALGGVGGAAASDLARWLLGGALAPAYGSVFAAEAVLFVVSAVLATQVAPARRDWRLAAAPSH
ncbi:BCD family MFS transporter [Piscinibacter sakaiensis]|uniref:Bacteriochlorophyll synthase, 44.5 kDa chain n=1 Tax=Piscinibacter sakaiensis TaxID=1547922 RepID=A0A0K8NVT9_PISS1|nr:BCD family MFS transporter [Piscinibacter sakaiensis]GAP34394.1 bacteriochlorophyll synthase, 44.5 kDa chain [Piscinibacter sakaiensis]